MIFISCVLLLRGYAIHGAPCKDYIEPKGKGHHEQNIELIEELVKVYHGYNL